MSLKEKGIVPKWKVIVQKGKIVFNDRKMFEEYIQRYEGKEMQLVIKNLSKDRSRSEEKYYHAVVVRMIAEEMQVTNEEAHEFLKGMFLKTERRTESGIRYQHIMSTTELDDRAYDEYIFEKCIRWASLPTQDDGLSHDSGLGLYIPHPNEVDYDNVF